MRAEAGGREVLAGRMAATAVGCRRWYSHNRGKGPRYRPAELGNGNKRESAAQKHSALRREKGTLFRDRGTATPIDSVTEGCRPTL